MFSGISIWQLLIILGIVVVLFGTKKLRNVGGDIGGAVKGFKDAMKDGEDGAQDADETRQLRDASEGDDDATSREPVSTKDTDTTKR